MLRRIRITLAVVVFAVITLYFLDFAQLLPQQFNIVTRIQFVPALLALSVLWIVLLLGLALIFGRVYCSVLCPLGIFQDVIARVSRLFSKKKKRFRYRKALTILRWSFVAIVLLVFLLGSPVLLGLLDPYSAYGRMVVAVFRPVYIAGNNVLESIFTHFNNYTFFRANAAILSISSFVTGLLTLLFVAYMAWKHGRTYCNTVCPVGTVLGSLSKYSLFRVRFDNHKCNNCSLCELNCKAFCIDSQNQQIDHSRCVTCFNCIDTCNRNALSYKFAYSKTKKSKEKGSEVDTGKRKFIATAIGSLVALPATVSAKAKGESSVLTRIPLTPPGSKSIEHMLKNCTSCHLCVSKCPTNILEPAFTEYGLSGFMMPTMKFQNGFCNYDCTICSEVCPTGAIELLTIEEKHTTQVGKIILNIEECIVYTDETNCGACAEHCPTQAVTMVPYKGALTIPETDQSICIGCGGCEYICPQTGKAIYIEGNKEHQKAEMFEEAEKKEFDFGGFGF